MTTTALDIITGAARLLQVVRKGEALDADEAADGLVALNDLIDSWSNESLMIIARAWETFSVSAASSYSIGSGQTLNTTRPVVIKQAFIRIGTIDYPLIPVSDEEFERIRYKSQTSSIPQYINIDNAYPYGTVRLYPQLNTNATLGILSEKPLSNFSSLSATVDLAPGSKRALRFNLAIDLAPEYSVEIPPNVMMGAADSKSKLALAVAKNRPIKFRRNKVPQGDIYSGWIQ